MLVAAAVAVVVVNRSFLSPVVISTIHHRYTFSLSRYTFSCLVKTAQTASGPAEAVAPTAVKERPFFPVVDTSVAPTATVDTVDRPSVSVVFIDAPIVTVDVVDRPSLSVVAAVAVIAVVDVVDRPSLSFVDSIVGIIVVVETGSRLNQDLTKHT